MGKIFISYRRSDSAYAAYSIYDRLARQFGEQAIVLDVDAVLIIIGDRWLDARAEDGSRRLDSPADPVRIETKAALVQGIAVIPGLVGHARMPETHGLPAGLRKLSYLNASEVRPGRDLPGHPVWAGRLTSHSV